MHRYSWAALAIFVVLADQSSKFWIESEMTLGGSMFLTPFLNLVYVLNTGAAFSILAEANGWQKYIFIAIASAVSVFLTLMLLKGKLKHHEQTCYSLLLGGAISNLLDRLSRGAVVDFIDLHVGFWYWPAFNIADSAIVLSVSALICSSLMVSIKSKAQQQ